MVQYRNTAGSYGMVAQAFHWIVAILVILQFPLGMYAADLPVSLARLQWLSRHKSLGLLILAIALLRLGWRAFNRPPALPAVMSRWQRAAAHVEHWLIYALLVAVPLTGWLYASAAGLPAGWFGLFAVPDLVPRDRLAAADYHDWHVATLTLLGVLVALHIGAAARHAFVRRDGIVQRMLPLKRQEP